MFDTAIIAIKQCFVIHQKLEVTWDPPGSFFYPLTCLGFYAIFQTLLNPNRIYEDGLMHVSSTPLVTGLGSLPHLDPAAALDLIAACCPALPFWPQLPQRSPEEMMVPQTLGPLIAGVQRREDGFSYALFDQAGFVGQAAQTDAELLPDHAAGFFAFEAALAAGDFADAVCLKGQLCGPVTLAAQLYPHLHAPQSCLSEPVVLTALADFVGRLAHWQAGRLGCFGRPVMMWLDEPALMLAQNYPIAQEALGTIIRELQAASVVVGLHCCAADCLPLLCHLQPDIVSFDATLVSSTDAAVDALVAFIAGGGRVSLGLVPNTAAMVESGTVQTLTQRWQRWADCLPPAFAEAGLLTATCGLGLASSTTARHSFALAAETRAQIRNLNLAVKPS